MKFEDYSRLSEFVKKGNNPYLALARICELISLTAETVGAGLGKINGNPYYCPRKFLKDLEQQFENDDSFRQILGPSIDKWGTLCLQDFLLEIGGTARLDWMRGFLKDCSDYLSSMSRLSDFENDPFQIAFFQHHFVEMQISPKFDNLEHAHEYIGLSKVSDYEPARKQELRERLQSGLTNLFGNKGVPEDVLAWLVSAEKGYEVRSRAYEVWMELMAACNCCLALLGRSHNDGWSRTLELVQTRTHGFPDGVCGYKATGDVYRKITRSLRENDGRVFVPVSKSDELIKKGLVRGAGDRKWFVAIVQVFRSSLLIERDNFRHDLTPLSFRQVGAAYCFLQYVACLYALKNHNENLDKSAYFPVKLLWCGLGSPEETDGGWFTKPNLLLAHFEDCLERKGADPTRIGSCALGIDEGVYSPIRSDDGGGPYTMREVSDDFHESFRMQVVRQIENIVVGRRRVRKGFPVRKRGLTKR